MVAALHGAGIEVLLDVVFNHTCEVDQTGPTYSYRGIDNSTYYLMTGDPAHPYADFSGTGNTLNCVNNAVRKMIIDSMRRWVRLGVDGFRFDLASVYARDAEGTLRYDEPPVFGQIASDPDFAAVRLIAEPWDAGSYQLGKSFPGMSWQQWNGDFRDDIRRFVRGDDGFVPRLMRRLYGSDDLFPDDRLNTYRPSQSVNYITCHDGPTLYDLVSYERKRNWANGHDNRDGPRDNFSWNCGHEGDENVPAAVMRLRIQQAKNLVALLFLANGTPMLRAGDEFLHTQLGNDNPYNQDGPLTWLDWTRVERFAEMLRFVRLMIAFRKAHPSLGRSRFWREDVEWRGASGPLNTAPGARHLAFHLRGREEDDGDIYVAVNAGMEPVPFSLPVGGGMKWARVIDTSRAAPEDFIEGGQAGPDTRGSYDVAPRSVVVFLADERRELL